MIGKIITGRSFRGAVEYILGKSNALLLDSDGVDTASVRSMIADLNFQRKTRPEIAKVVGHISLSFHRDDAPKLSDDRMRELATAYMERMGITDTQYIVVRHSDTEHPHLHILYNRVRYDKKLVPDKNERCRNVRICRELKQLYGLTFSKGKERVKTERLHAPDCAKYAIYDAITAILPHCSSCLELAAKLKNKGIQTAFIHRGNDLKKEVQGITFTKGGHTFKGSKIDRKYSYAGLEKLIREQSEKQAQGRIDKEIKNTQEPRQDPTNSLLLEPQKMERLQPNTVQPVSAKPQLSEVQYVEIDGTRFTQKQWRLLQENRTLKIVIRVKDAAVLQEYWYDKADHLQKNLVALQRSEESFVRYFVTDLKGYRLTAQEQKELYSKQGLIKAFRKQDGTVYRSRFGVRSNPGQKDVLTECILAVKHPQEVKPETKLQTQQEQPQQREGPQVRTYPTIIKRKKGRGI